MNCKKVSHFFEILDAVKKEYAVLSHYGGRPTAGAEALPNPPEVL